jgi:hypothetical protein
MHKIKVAFHTVARNAESNWNKIPQPTFSRNISRNLRFLRNCRLAYLDEVHAETEAGGGLGGQNVRLIPDVLPPPLPQFAARFFVHLVEPALQVAQAPHLTYTKLLLHLFKNNYLVRYTYFWQFLGSRAGSVGSIPYVFGPPGSGSISQRYGYGSGCLYYHQAKIVRKKLIPTVL